MSFRSLFFSAAVFKVLKCSRLHMIAILGADQRCWIHQALPMSHGCHVTNAINPLCNRQGKGRDPWSFVFSYHTISLNAIVLGLFLFCFLISAHLYMCVRKHLYGFLLV